MIPADYSSESHRARLVGLLGALYSRDLVAEILPKIAALIARHVAHANTALNARDLTERDSILISYADQLQEAGRPPLQTLASFCRSQLTGVVSGVHLLPFYPWSSDDGFSVKDYFAVEPSYGSWHDIMRFRPEFELMFDAVFNHASAESDWFTRFLKDEFEFRDFFVTVMGKPDLSQVVRPRALPLLTEFHTARGPEKVWTTFSADQVDLNVQNPRVLLVLLEALLFYVSQGARFIRLDAIAYLWKELGTPCIHLPQTHAVIQLMRAVLDEAAPGIQLITETNVPHSDNISYFGDGTNEAQLVYNFALPPLVMHALLRGDATYLTRWAASLTTPFPRCTFFNFLASHDGIGVNPARGILPALEIDFLVERCVAHGGFISYKHIADGSKLPYEMNIVYFDAVNDPSARETEELQVSRFLVAQAVMLALAGVPGIYFHSLFGSRNDREAALQTGINRRINRLKLSRLQLEQELERKDSVRARVFERFKNLLTVRSRQPAFSPRAAQRVLSVDPCVFALLRGSSVDGSTVLCLHNFSANGVSLNLELGDHGSLAWTELFGDLTRHQSRKDRLLIELQPYEIKWLSGSRLG